MNLSNPHLLKQHQLSEINWKLGLSDSTNASTTNLKPAIIIAPYNTLRTKEEIADRALTNEEAFVR